jgi:hypothetical protein
VGHDLNEDSFAMELSGGLGTGGMALAPSKGCRVLVTDQDENRLSKANRMAEQGGLGHLISTQRVDMTLLDLEVPEKILGTGEFFDAAVVEASLIHCPLMLKEKSPADVGKLSKQVWLHELCFNRRHRGRRLRGGASNQMPSWTVVGHWLSSIDITGVERLVDKM